MTIMGKVNKIENKHSSKSQKKKLKTTKKGKKEFKSTGKRGRLIVRNLPFKCNENELHKHFSSFGEVVDIQLLRRPDNKLVGCGFVEFGSRLNADKAKEQLNGQLFLGRPIYVDRAVSREHYDETSKNVENKTDEDEMSEADNDLNENGIKSESEEGDNLLNETEIKQELNSDEEGEPEKNTNVDELRTITDKSSKKNNNAKKARLIVRNLSFKTTEDKLKAHFSQYGEVEDVKLLRRQDNTLVGCGFVQFTTKQKAAKAIHYASGRPFLDRPIIVDWAVGKDQFKKMQEEALKKEIKPEDEGDEDIKPVKKEEESDEETNKESEESESDDDEEEERDSEDDGESEEVIKPVAKAAKRKRIEDVDEGKTVFIKNLPFSVDNEEFKECMEQYGPVFYALVCKDKFTDHSRGTGFVKFKEKKDAEKCLNAGTELTLNGTILDPHPALKRNDIQKLNEKNKEKKDNRNIYLVKEGTIIAGTEAAKGVSMADMERRLQLEQWKASKLRNLNMFVSRNRLVIHNLPKTFSDKQLRKLFQSHAGPKAVIKEARVMRDLNTVDSQGKCMSKGYAFVSFEQHEDALKAMRSINNNPSIFTPIMRPIVAFSIENRTVLNAKTKRMIRSRQKNPLCKDFTPNEEVPTKKVQHGSNEKNQVQNEPQYAGIAAKPGTTVQMRKKFKLKDQAQQHFKNVKREKHDIKMSRKVRRIEHIKKKQVQKSTKRKNKTENDTAFTNLVDKYKTKILSEKKKWYDE